MRFFVGVILMLFTQGATFAQSALPASSPDGKTASVRKTIDRLNDAAHDSYLKSPDSARAMAEKALLLAEQAKYTTGIGRSFLNIGHVYWSQSYYPVALVYLNKALMNLPLDNPLLLADCYEITGRTYAELGNYKEAFANLDKSERFAGNDPDRLAEVHSERSYIYLRVKDYEKAIAETKQGLVLNNLAKDPGNRAILYGRLSSIYRHQKLYKQALAYSDTAYRMSIATHNNRLLALTYVDFARIFNELHSYDKAIVFAKKGIDLANSIGVVDVISSAYSTMVKSYELKNDAKHALEYQKAYAVVRDSINKFEIAKNTELLQSYFELNNRINEMAAFERNEQAIKAKVKSQRLTIISLSLLLIFVIALLIVTWYYYKQKKQLNKQLRAQHQALVEHKQLIEAQTANLQMVSQIKDKLLAVIGHDLRTPFANLRNMIDMFDADFISTEEVHELMKEINPLIKGAELTLNNLMDWAGSHIKGRIKKAANLDIFLMGVEMEQTFNHALQRKNIEFVNQAGPGQSVIADENHIKVVLRNLISNAIKFTDNKGCIRLSSTYTENQVIISVEDNGKGMTADEVNNLFVLQTHFTRPGTLGENGTGIGLLLCKELVELNGGSLWTKSKPGKGSIFYFSLPLNTAYA